MTVKTQFDILNILESIINVSAVTTLLGVNGKVWRDKMTTTQAGFEYLDVVIVVNPIIPVTEKENGLGGVVQGGIANINIFAPDIDGQRDEVQLNSIGAEVIIQLGAFDQDVNNINYSIRSQGMISDIDRTNMSYLNIVLNYTIT